MQAPGAAIAFLGSAHVRSIARIYQNSSDILMVVRIHTGPLCARKMLLSLHYHSFLNFEPLLQSSARKFLSETEVATNH